MKYFSFVDGNEFELDLQEINDHVEIKLGRTQYTVDLDEVGTSHFYSILVNNQSYDLIVEEDDGEYYVKIAGYRYQVSVEDELERSLEKSVSHSKDPHAPETMKSQMPGLVIRIEVSAGDSVEEGALLMIIEAMKMENEIRARRAGKVKKIHVGEQESVNSGDPLIVIG